MGENTYLLIIGGLTVLFLINKLGFLDRLRGINSLSPREAHQLISDQEALVLDVREKNEYAAYHIPRSRHIPLGQIRRRVNELKDYRDRPIVVNCRSGARSRRACAMLKKSGYSQVYNLKGGLQAWRGANLDLDTGQSRRKRRR